jgi:hypothetical protein
MLSIKEQIIRNSTKGELLPDIGQSLGVKHGKRGNGPVGEPCSPYPAASKRQGKSGRSYLKGGPCVRGRRGVVTPPSLACYPS